MKNKITQEKVLNRLCQKFENKDFRFLKDLEEEFPKAEIYLVGGAVRDLLLGRKCKDYDFIIREVEANDLQRFLEKRGKVNLVGKTFGVFKFVPFGGDIHNPFDIALPRTEHSLGTGGYRDFDVQSSPTLSIKEDLSRRDFTINAMAFDIKNNKLIDPFNGLKDLKEKKIRAVRNPEERFKEDYSRMLRAIRLACQLNLEIEKNTWKAIKQNITHLNDVIRRVEMVSEGPVAEQKISETRAVPYEVIAKEFLKSFYYNPVKAFDLYDKSGAFKEIMPEILKMKNCPQPENWHSEGDVWVHTRLALEKLNSPEFKKQFGDKKPSLQLILAVLFHDLGKPYTIKIPEKDGVDRIRFNEHDVIGAKIAKEICQRLKLSSPENYGIDPDKIAWLIQHHMLLVQGDVSKMRPSTIEKYFFNKNNPGEDLLKLSFVDISATIPKEKKDKFKEFKEMLKRIKEFKKLSKSKKELPEPILNGYEIMKEFNLGPGPLIGKLKTSLREKQLSGEIKNKEEAINFLKELLKNRG